MSHTNVGPPLLPTLKGTRCQKGVKLLNRPRYLPSPIKLEHFDNFTESNIQESFNDINTEELFPTKSMKLEDGIQPTISTEAAPINMNQSRTDSSNTPGKVEPRIAGPALLPLLKGTKSQAGVKILYNPKVVPAPMKIEFLEDVLRSNLTNDTAVVTSPGLPPLSTPTPGYKMPRKSIFMEETREEKHTAVVTSPGLPPLSTPTPGYKMPRKSIFMEETREEKPFDIMFSCEVRKDGPPRQLNPSVKMECIDTFIPTPPDSTVMFPTALPCQDQNRIKASISQDWIANDRKVSNGEHGRVAGNIQNNSDPMDSIMNAINKQMPVFPPMLERKPNCVQESPIPQRPNYLMKYISKPSENRKRFVDSSNSMLARRPLHVPHEFGEWEQYSNYNSEWVKPRHN